MSRIPDILWKSIETILPRKKSSRGRPEMDPRKALEGIFYILRTGGNGANCRAFSVHQVLFMENF